jgi:hypothetical protein
MTREVLREELIRDLDRLSPESLREVRTFVRFLQRKSSNASVFDTIEASIDAIPEEEWEDVPSDASSRLDEYLYQSDSFPL